MSKIEFGWVQDANNFNRLKKTVSLLDKDSKYHNYFLNNNLINNIYVSKKDPQHLTHIIKGLKHSPVKLHYSQLVGRDAYPDGFNGHRTRSNALPYGLVQISASGANSKKNWTSDWVSRCFVNWALTLNLFKLDYEDCKSDPFILITKLGKQFAEAPNDKYIDSSQQHGTISIEESILQKAIMAYPPAVRILRLLNKNHSNLTSKFELGSHLGFIGEPGFTSFNEGDWVHDLAERPLPKTATAKWLKKENYSNPSRNSFRSNVEGDSDKWARTIAGWLCKVGLVIKHKKSFPNLGPSIYIPQAYQITNDGQQALKKANGYSKHLPTKKYISWQMLATRVQNRDYIRLRRGYTIKAMQKYNDLKDIAITLKQKSLFNGYQTLLSDLIGLRNFGLNFVIEPNKDMEKYKVNFEDRINDFAIPSIPNKQAITNPKLYKIINHYKKILKNLSGTDFQLIELSQLKAKTRSRNTVMATNFEKRVVDFMKKYLHLNGKHLGGPLKPDGILYYKNKLGIILDTKQYSKGYDLPIEQQREMIDYITDFEQHDERNSWWKTFGPIRSFSKNNTYYLWVSRLFKGNYQNGLNHTHDKTDMNGAAMPIIPLLIIGNASANNLRITKNLYKLMKNKEITKDMSEKFIRANV